MSLHTSQMYPIPSQKAMFVMAYKDKKRVILHITRNGYVCDGTQKIVNKNSETCMKML